MHDTDIISYYHRPFNADDSYPLMDEMGVKEIAETFLKNIVSEERFNTFAYSGMTMDALGRYALSYIRYVEGYPTDEVLSVWVDRCGDVSGYNGYNLQKYDSIEKTISKEKLDVAKKFL